MKVLKKLILFLLLFLILLLGVSAWFVYRIDLNQYKSNISHELTRIIGHPTEIRGKIKWRLLPNLGISITNVIINGPQTTEAPFLAKIGNLTTNVNLVSLLKGKFDVNEFIVSKADVYLPWPEKTSHNLPKGTKPSEKSTKADEPHLYKEFAFKRIDIKDLIIYYQTNDLPTTLIVQQLTAKDIKLQRAFPITAVIFIKQSNANSFINSEEININATLKLDKSGIATPSDITNNLSLNGTLSTKRLQLRNLLIDKLTTRFQFKDRQLQFNPISVKLAQGRVQSSLTIDMAYHTLMFRAKGRQINLNALPINNKKPLPLSGKLQFDMLLKNPNLLSKNFLNSSYGSGNIAVYDGQLKMVDLPQLIEWLSNHLQKNTNLSAIFKDLFVANNKPLFKSKPTHFSYLKNQFVLQKGILYSKSLHVSAPPYDINGNGHVNLLSKHLDFNLNLSIDNPKNQTIKRIQALLNGHIPLKMSGPINAPRVVPNIDVISKHWSKYLIKQEMEGLNKSLKKGIKSFNDSLKALVE